jgi:tetratricopeptide (TPR) repeat protein
MLSGKELPMRFDMRFSPMLLLFGKGVCFFCILMGMVLCPVPGNAQESSAPPSEQELMKALHEVWLQVGREPAPGEVDSLGKYAAAVYLGRWGDWAAVRAALVTYLMQQGQIALTQWQPEKALKIFRHARMADPISTGVIRGIEEAERRMFIPERAGVEAVVAYEKYLSLRAQRRHELAEAPHQEAFALKESYHKRTIERLEATYRSAVEAFEKEEYERAKELFDSLKLVTGRYAGFAEVISPHASEIDAYLRTIDDRLTQKKFDLIKTHTHHGRLTFWSLFMFYAMGKESVLFSVRTTRGRTERITGLERESRFGYEIGIAARITPRFRAGLNGGLMINSPGYIIYEGVKFFESPKGSVKHISLSIESELVQRGRWRMYGQAGGSIVNANFPQTTRAELVTGSPSTGPRYEYTVFPEYAQTAPGFLIGFGGDIWIGASKAMIGGVRFDVRYHYVREKPVATPNTRYDLDGVRIGVGMVLSR